MIKMRCVFTGVSVQVGDIIRSGDMFVVGSPNEKGVTTIVILGCSSGVSVKDFPDTVSRPWVCMLSDDGKTLTFPLSAKSHLEINLAGLPFPVDINNLVIEAMTTQRARDFATTHGYEL